MKILSLALVLGMSAQSFAGAVKASDEETKRLEKEYQESSDYTLPVTVGIGVVILGAAGLYFLGPVGAVGGAAVAAMQVPRSPGKIGSKEVRDLLRHAAQIQNSPK